MKKEKVIKILNQEFPTNSTVWFKLNSGTQFVVTGNRCKIVQDIVEIYNGNDPVAIVYLDDIQLLRTIG